MCLKISASNAVYPTKYGYDPDYGRRTSMTTYQDSGIVFTGTTWPSAADATGKGQTTHWEYDNPTGLLTSKTDAADPGNTVTYTYETGGRLKTRAWAEGGVTTYTYDQDTGELTGIDYPGGTPDVSFTYDNLGRQTQIIDGLGTRVFGYNDDLQLKTETIDQDGPNERVITRSYSHGNGGVEGRPNGFDLGNNYSIDYGFDNKGRFNTLGWDADGAMDTATYSYASKSNLLESMTTPGGLRTFYAYEDNRNLKEVVLNRWKSNPISRYDYGYDDLGRRKSVVNSGDAFNATGDRFNAFGYNSRNELTLSQRYEGPYTDTPDTDDAITDEYRQYTYDHIGNRLEVTEGLAVHNYDEPDGVDTPNDLNQYTRVDFAGQTKSFTYDDDGNMTSMEGYTYTYNAENRLIAVYPDSPVDGDTLVRYLYDYMGRRVQRIESTRSSGAWGVAEETLYVYDGWNLVEEIKDGESKYYVWGLDLSQSLQGAGGVGGLLASVEPATYKTLYYMYDANGNVGQLVDGADGSIAARYEYDPYGNELVAEGVEAAGNAFRFSTKYLDGGLYYYGYRWYLAGIGRWNRRDPAEDGANLYAFVGNGPVGIIDLLGLANFRVGAIGPVISRDRGAGAYDSHEASLSDHLAKGVIEAGIIYARRNRGWTDAADNLAHFLGGTGQSINIKFGKMLTEVPNEKREMDSEIRDAVEWIKNMDKSISSDRHFFFNSQSSRPNLYVDRAENENWYYAVGGYSGWGEGEVRRCGTKYLVKFTYSFSDRYNWDGGKETEFACPDGVPCGIVPMTGWTYDESSNDVTITDEVLAKLHRTGLAQEFNMYGQVDKFIEWKGQEQPQITDGLPANGAWPGLYD